jgi:hypothetical protein
MPSKKKTGPKRKRGRPPKDPREHRIPLVTTISQDTMNYIAVLEKEMGLSRGKVIDLFAEVFKMANAEKGKTPKTKTKAKPATKK